MFTPTTKHLSVPPPSSFITLQPPLLKSRLRKVDNNVGPNYRPVTHSHLLIGCGRGSYLDHDASIGHIFE